jgi:hypothetical protein
MHGMGELDRLAAGAAAVRGMDRISANRLQPAVLHVREQTTSDAAVRALGADRLHFVKTAHPRFPRRFGSVNAA